MATELYRYPRVRCRCNAAQVLTFSNGFPKKKKHVQSPGLYTRYTVSNLRQLRYAYVPSCNDIGTHVTRWHDTPSHIAARRAFLRSSTGGQRARVTMSSRHPSTLQPASVQLQEHPTICSLLVGPCHSCTDAHGSWLLKTTLSKYIINHCPATTRGV